ncbi:PH domain-containing protein [Actinomadura viridis]|uniref:PH domain-containing protein n=1 Tax=Actinomadura viridis TaxID=58110 RepID=UPI00367DA233
MTPLLTIRSTGARVGAWAFVAFAALNLLDIAVRGRDMASVVMTALLLLGCGIAYVLGLRPAVVADEEGLTVRNPLRDARVPWPAARRIEGAEALMVTFAQEGGGECKVRSWVLHTSPRAQAKAEARARRDARHQPGAVAAKLKGRTPATYAAQQLNEIADRHRPKAAVAKGGRSAPPEASGGTGALTWSRAAVAALAAPGALVIVAALLALLG